MKTNLYLKLRRPTASWLSYLENLHSKSIDLGLERVSGGARLDILKPAPFVLPLREPTARYDLSHAGVGVNRGGIPCGRL